MLWAIAAVCLIAAPDASVALRPISEVTHDVFEAALKARKTAFDLSRQGRYDDAAAGIDAAVAQAEKTLVPYAADPKRPTLVPDQKLAAAYRARGQLALKAPTDKNSAWLLLQSLVDNKALDIERTTLADPRAQALLDLLRKIDPKAKALFAPRKLKVVVDAPTLKDTLKELYVQQLVANLRLLGLAASSEEGDEEFHVVYALGQELAAGEALGVKGLISCEAVAVGTWKAKGKVEMANLDLGRRAAGFADIPDSCLKSPLKPSAELAPIMVLRNYAAR